MPLDLPCSLKDANLSFSFFILEIWNADRLTRAMLLPRIRLIIFPMLICAHLRDCAILFAEAVLSASCCAEVASGLTRNDWHFDRYQETPTKTHETNEWSIENKAHKTEMNDWENKNGKSIMNMRRNLCLGKIQSFQQQCKVLKKHCIINLFMKCSILKIKSL